MPTRPRWEKIYADTSSEPHIISEEEARAVFAHGYQCDPSELLDLCREQPGKWLRANCFVFVRAVYD